jgi:cytochrome c-type biogenesis protein CcmE
VGQWIQDRGYSYNRQKDLFTFYMKDSTQHVEQVHYYDPKPTNFESAEKVVVVGQYQQEGFVAKRILMKCPSKYKNNQLETQQASTGPGQTNSYSRTEAQGSDL